MKLHERIEQIKSKEDLADFVSALSASLVDTPDRWENPTLERFLSAMEEWIRGMDGYFKNTGQEPVTNPTWKTFAQILYASKIYE